MVFCKIGMFDVILWGLRGLYPTARQIGEAEWKLLLFGTWLHKAAYASGTIVNYVGAVKKWHELAIGLPDRAVGVVFYRLPLLFRVVKRLNPAKIRDKRPWEYEYLES